MSDIVLAVGMTTLFWAIILAPIIQLNDKKSRYIKELEKNNSLVKQESDYWKGISQHLFGHMKSLVFAPGLDKAVKVSKHVRSSKTLDKFLDNLL